MAVTANLACAVSCPHGVLGMILLPPALVGYAPTRVLLPQVICSYAREVEQGPLRHVGPRFIVGPRGGRVERCGPYGCQAPLPGLNHRPDRGKP